MGEQAEYEIWRRHGVDISDDDRFERRKKRPFIRDPGPITNLAELMKAAGVEMPPSRKELLAQGKWRIGTGEILEIKDLEDRHVYNIWRWAERKELADVAARFEAEYNRRDQRQKGASNMNTQEIITVMQIEAGAQLVKVRFEDFQNANIGKEYSYKCVLGRPLALNDLVLVQAPTGPKLARVSQPNVNPADLGCAFADLKHVVAVIDLSEFEKIEARETAARNKLAMAEVSNRLAKYRETMGITALENARDALNGRERNVGFRSRFTAADDSELIDTSDV